MLKYFCSSEMLKNPGAFVTPSPSSSPLYLYLYESSRTLETRRGRNAVEREDFVFDDKHRALLSRKLSPVFVAFRANLRALSCILGMHASSSVHCGFTIPHLSKEDHIHADRQELILDAGSKRKIGKPPSVTAGDRSRSDKGEDTLTSAR